MPGVVGCGVPNDEARPDRSPTEAIGGPPLFSFVASLFCYLGDDAGYAIGSNADKPGVRSLLRSIGSRVRGSLGSRALTDALNAGTVPAGVDVLSNAGRVFVWHSRTENDIAEMRELAGSLLRYGPNLLLWIADEDAEHPAGMVEYIRYGLLRGFVTAATAELSAEGRDLDSWQAMWQAACVAADVLRERGEWSYRAYEEAHTRCSGSIGLQAAAATIHVAEAAGPFPDAGPVRLGAVRFPGDLQSGDPAHNPGSRTIRTAVLERAILHAAAAIAIVGDRRIKETQYGQTDAEFDGLEVDGYGLRFCHTDKTAIIGYNTSWDNYYHWFAQCLPAIAHSASIAGKDRCVLVVRALQPWQEESLRLLGLADMPRISVNLWKPYFFNRMIYCEYLGGRSQGYISPFINGMMARMAEGIAVSDDAPKRLYVSRSDASRRRLANERQIEAALRSRGFTIIVPSALSLVEQIRLFKGADAVVGPHGAGMTNIGFCRPGIKVLELTPGYMRLFMVRIAQGAGLDYRVACFEANNIEQQDWSVDVGQLLEMVSEMIVPAG